MAGLEPVKAPEERRLHALPLDAQCWEACEGAVRDVVCQEVVNDRRRNDPADVLRLTTSIALQHIKHAVKNLWWPQMRAWAQEFQRGRLHPPPGMVKTARCEGAPVQWLA